MKLNPTVVVLLLLWYVVFNGSLVVADDIAVVLIFIVISVVPLLPIISVVVIDEVEEFNISFVVKTVEDSKIVGVNVVGAVVPLPLLNTGKIVLLIEEYEDEIKIFVVVLPLIEDSVVSVTTVCFCVVRFAWLGVFKLMIESELNEDKEDLKSTEAVVSSLPEDSVVSVACVCSSVVRLLIFTGIGVFILVIEKELNEDKEDCKLTGTVVPSSGEEASNFVVMLMIVTGDLLILEELSREPIGVLFCREDSVVVFAGTVVVVVTVIVTDCSSVISVDWVWASDPPDVLEKKLSIGTVCKGKLFVEDSVVKKYSVFFSSSVVPNDLSFDKDIEVELFTGHSSLIEDSVTVCMTFSVVFCISLVVNSSVVVIEFSTLPVWGSFVAVVFISKVEELYSELSIWISSVALFLKEESVVAIFSSCVVWFVAIKFDCLFAVMVVSGNVVVLLIICVFVIVAEFSVGAIVMIAEVKAYKIDIH